MARPESGQQSGTEDREAARLYMLAADQGNADAQVNLGFFYEMGRGGLSKDDHEAARLDWALGLLLFKTEGAAAALEPQRRSLATLKALAEANPRDARTLRDLNIIFGAVIDDSKGNPSLLRTQFDPGMPGTAVLDDVLQGLLRDAVEAQGRIVGDRRRHRMVDEFDRQAVGLQEFD